MEGQMNIDVVDGQCESVDCSLNQRTYMLIW